MCCTTFLAIIWSRFCSSADSSNDLAVAQSEWQALNQQLRDNGFSGMELASSAQSAGAEGPTSRQLLDTIQTVLKQYDRRAHLVHELLAATDLARDREQRVDDTLSSLRKYVLQLCMPGHMGDCLHDHTCCWPTPTKPVSQHHECFCYFPVLVRTMPTAACCAMYICEQTPMTCCTQCLGSICQCYWPGVMLLGV